jgi:hypothetical protein
VTATVVIAIDVPQRIADPMTIAPTLPRSLNMHTPPFSPSYRLSDMAKHNIGCSTTPGD